MQRIRLFRILIPILLLGLLVAVAVTLRSRPQPNPGADEPPSDLSARMEGFRFSDLVGGRRRLLVHARVGRVDDQGAFEVEQVERFEVDRETMFLEGGISLLICLFWLGFLLG